MSSDEDEEEYQARRRAMQAMKPQSNRSTGPALVTSSSRTFAGTAAAAVVVGYSGSTAPDPVSAPVTTSTVRVPKKGKPNRSDQVRRVKVKYANDDYIAAARGNTIRCSFRDGAGNQCANTSNIKRCFECTSQCCNDHRTYISFRGTDESVEPKMTVNDVHIRDGRVKLYRAEENPSRFYCNARCWGEMGRRGFSTKDKAITTVLFSNSVKIEHLLLIMGDAATPSYFRSLFTYTTTGSTGKPVVTMTVRSQDMIAYLQMLGIVRDLASTNILNGYRAASSQSPHLDFRTTPQRAVEYFAAVANKLAGELHGDKNKNAIVEFEKAILCELFEKPIVDAVMHDIKFACPVCKAKDDPAVSLRAKDVDGYKPGRLRTGRECDLCGEMVCLAHSKFPKSEGVFICLGCSRSVLENRNIGVGISDMWDTLMNHTLAYRTPKSFIDKVLPKEMGGMNSGHATELDKIYDKFVGWYREYDKEDKTNLPARCFSYLTSTMWAPKAFLAHLCVWQDKRIKREPKPADIYKVLRAFVLLQQIQLLLSLRVNKELVHELIAHEFDVSEILPFINVNTEQQDATQLAITEKQFRAFLEKQETLEENAILGTKQERQADENFTRPAPDWDEKWTAEHNALGEYSDEMLGRIHGARHRNPNLTFPEAAAIALESFDEGEAGFRNIQRRLEENYANNNDRILTMPSEEQDPEPVPDLDEYPEQDTTDDEEEEEEGASGTEDEDEESELEDDVNDNGKEGSDGEEEGSEEEGEPPSKRQLQRPSI